MSKVRYRKFVKSLKKVGSSSQEKSWVDLWFEAKESVSVPAVIDKEAE